MDLTTVSELSKKIRKAPSSIYSDLIRNPKSLPPLFRLPGSRKVLFINVDQWIASHAQQPQEPISGVVSTEARRRPGRPRKTQ